MRFYIRNNTNQYLNLSLYVDRKYFVDFHISWIFHETCKAKILNFVDSRVTHENFLLKNSSIKFAILSHHEKTCPAVQLKTMVHFCDSQTLCKTAKFMISQKIFSCIVYSMLLFMHVCIYHKRYILG